MSFPNSDQEKKDTIIVTGNNGLLGKHICRKLMHDYQVIGFDRDGQPQPEKEIECVCVDVGDDDSVERGLNRVRHAYGGRIASVIHLAAYYDFSGESSDLYDEVTVEGTRRLIRGLQYFDVGQFIFSSSMLVHAPTVPGEPINENAPLEPKWDYPESKVKAEEVIREERGSIPALALRIAGVYTHNCDSIPLSQQIRRICENRLTAQVYPGELEHGQCFVHLDDVARAFTLAVEKRAQHTDFQPILIGEEETMSYGEMQSTLGILLTGDEWETEEIPKSLAASGAWLQDNVPGISEPFIKPWMIELADDHFELNIDRAREVLHWQPRHNLRETLPHMIESLRKDPRSWYARHGFDPDDAEKGTANLQAMIG